MGSDISRILIWGSGAIGGTVGAFWARAGHDVTFVDIEPEHVRAMTEHGLTLTGPLDAFTIPVQACLPDQVAGVWDLVFLCVKAHHTSDACRSLAPHLGPDGVVVSLQNGLCEHLIADRVGAARTMGAFVNFGADWIAPGEVHYANRGAFVLGELDGQISPRLKNILSLARIFEPDAIATDTIEGYIWGKLGYGAFLFAQALGDKGIADCIARPELLPLWRALAGDVARVAAAQGIIPCGFNGYDPAAFAPEADEAAARSSIDALVAFARPNAKTHSGIWRDLAVRKRKTEVDVQIWPIVEIGRQHGVTCRAIAALVEMIHEVERGERPLSDDNLLELLRRAID